MIPALLSTVWSRGVVDSPSNVASLAVDWSTFLSRADPTWYPSSSGAPTKWYESAFLGNGALGMMVRTDADSLLFPVSSTSTWDDR